MSRVVGEKSSLLPSNIERGLVTTLVFDNIYWKINDLKGKETQYKFDIDSGNTKST